MTHLPFPEHWGSLKLLPGSTQLLAFTIRSSRSTTSGAVGEPTRSTPAEEKVMMTMTMMMIIIIILSTIFWNCA